jgi:hypothetical protein
MKLHHSSRPRMDMGQFKTISKVVCTLITSHPCIQSEIASIVGTNWVEIGRISIIAVIHSVICGSQRVSRNLTLYKDVKIAGEWKTLWVTPIV